MFWRRKKLFAEVADRLLRLKEVKSKRTKENAAWQIRRLVKNFGRLPVKEITEDHWGEYIAREYRLRPRTFYDDRKYMGMILRLARRRGEVSRIVELGIPDLPCDAGREIEPREIAALRKHAGPILRFQIEIARRTGLRLREMMRLRWDQIDWEKFTIRLLRADTKTRRGRIVPVPASLIAQFRARRGTSGAHFVFPHPSDPSRPQDSNKTAWRRCKAKAGVRARWHDWRHTCATVMLRRGVHAEAVRRCLGMSRKILSRYTHFSSADLFEIGRVMGRRR